MQKLKKVLVRKFSDIWVGDFETTTIRSEYFKRNGKGRLIAFEVQKLGKENERFVGCSMKDFEKWFMTLEGNHQIYFHNLGRFDAFVLLNWALQYWDNELIKENTDSLISFSYMKAKNKIMAFYIRNKKTRATLVCNDSYLLLTYSIAALGKMIGLPKSTTDYDVEPVDRLEDLPKQYLEYLHNDVCILNRSLVDFATEFSKIKEMWNIDADWNKMTISNLSRRIIEEFDWFKDFKITFKSQVEAGPYYRGGYTAGKMDVIDKELKGKFLMLDRKSHYPSIMWVYALPAKEPIFIDNVNEIDDFDCVMVRVVGVVKRNKNNWATLPVKGEFDNYIYTQESKEFEFYGSYYEWSLQENFYEFEWYEITAAYGWEKTQNHLNEVIETFYQAKETKANKLTYKLFLNSLSGSCGMRANFPETFFFTKDETKPHMHETKSKIFNYAKKKRDCYFKDYEEHEYDVILDGDVKCWNKWIAAYITSIGRAILQRVILMAPEHVYYGDTDSILVDDKFPLDKLKMGKDLNMWGIDMDGITRIKIQGPKRYLLGTDDKVLKTSFAGLTKTIWNPDNFDDSLQTFDAEYIEDGQQRVILSSKYDWFPLIENIDYKNSRKIELNRRANEKDSKG